MSRILPEVPEQDDTDAFLRPVNLASNSTSSISERADGLWTFRLLVALAITAGAWLFGPFGLTGWAAAGLGLALGCAVFLIENRLKRSSASALLGGAAGGLLGALGAFLVTMVIARLSAPDPAKSFLSLASLLAFGYLGVRLGSQKLRLPGLGFATASAPQPTASEPRVEGKLLDTSVLIDGRIADICEAHFLDGPLLVPQFVLHELQAIADSPDSLRRQRGRRGLEVLQRIQKIERLEVRILEDVAGQGGEVDRKLVDLALRFHAKIVTNDFNLNKVATVQGVSILNVNQLANALRPAVLPGEGMRVFILREGKEANQGVAYLEDGTMVVVDGARRLINKTVDILVTSVHQTPAGKMIFGRVDERHDSAVRQAAVARSERPSAVRPLYPEAGGE